MERIESLAPPREIPEDAHWWFATRTWAIEAWLQQLLQLPEYRDLQILDVGCGAGNMIHHLSRYGRVRGIEMDARPVKMAQARGYDVRQADATRRIPFDDATFDLVTALDVIEHVDDDVAILREAYRVLKPGGRILVTTPAFQWLWSYNDELNAHKRRYSARALGARFAQANLRVRRMSYNFFLVFPLAAGMIFLRNRLQRRTTLGSMRFAGPVGLKSHHFDQEAYQVDMEPTSPLLNTVLRGVGRVESSMIRVTNLPFGTSLIVLAEKN